MAQFRNLQHARPNRSLVSDFECQAGCGVVPIRYQDKQYTHSLQWTIGLELMLLVEDPWRIFLTTDHPNGGPFTGYPHLMRLLMDRNFRLAMLERLHPAVRERTLLRELTREYTLDEIAIMTRAAPAKILGLSGLGSLNVGCLANLAAYQPEADWESSFSQAMVVYKSGQPIIQQGQVVDWHAPCYGWRADIGYDSDQLAGWADAIQQTLRMPLGSLEITEHQAELLGRSGEMISRSERAN
jgi:formylmethanofuran dehydrogenase subunit A